MSVRAAVTTDLSDIARMHADRISEGFLSSLGIPFLRRLYARVLRSPDCFLLVDDGTERRDDGGPNRATGFIAGVEDLGALYRRFLMRDGILAGLRAAPRLIAAVPRVVETLRYPSTTATLPDAEILAVAVAAAASGRGVGRGLVSAATEEFRRRSVHAAKVVTTADNQAALAMYRGAGFTPIQRREVHAGRSSEVLVWTAS